MSIRHNSAITRVSTSSVQHAPDWWRQRCWKKAPYCPAWKQLGRSTSVMTEAAGPKATHSSGRSLSVSKETACCKVKRTAPDARCQRARTKPMLTPHHKAVLDGGRRAGSRVSGCITCSVCVDAQQTTASHASMCTTSAARSHAVSGHAMLRDAILISAYRLRGVSRVACGR